MKKVLAASCLYYVTTNYFVQRFTLFYFVYAAVLEKFLLILFAGNVSNYLLLLERKQSAQFPFTQK